MMSYRKAERPSAAERAYQEIMLELFGPDMIEVYGYDRLPGTASRDRSNGVPVPKARRRARTEGSR